MRTAARALTAFVSLLLFLNSNVAEAAEIRVLAPTTIRPEINALGPQFERTTGRKLLVAYDVAPAGSCP